MSEGSGRMRERAGGLASAAERLKSTLDRFHI
jgi:hypothetical protein